MKPKVLVISRDSWNETNNSGNTLSNLFQDWDSDRIANLYCRDEIPNNTICTNYFKISESLLFKKLFRKIKFAGLRLQKKFDITTIISTDDLKNDQTEKNIYDFFRNNRWYIFLWVRELLWKAVNWKSKELKSFLDDFKPEIIYSPSYDSFYMHEILFFVKTYTNAKVVLFHNDDLVTYRHYSWSPFFWINRFVLRQYMNKSISIADKNYCIIDEQSKVYKSIYNIDFNLLYKTGNFFSIPDPIHQQYPLKIVYTGNINCGRIDSIIEIGNALQKINVGFAKAKLYLYTANSISKKLKEKLIVTGNIEIMGKVSYDEIPGILANSNILLHVESFQKQQMYITSLSFSTKIVDYLEAARPILAMGWEHAASVKLLKDNKIAVTVNKINTLDENLDYLINNLDNLNSLGIKAWQFGYDNYNKNRVLKNFEKDLYNLIVKFNK